MRDPIAKYAVHLLPDKRKVGNDSSSEVVGAVSLLPLSKTGGLLVGFLEPLEKPSLEISQCNYLLSLR
jgi:hypothetical protein